MKNDEIIHTSKQNINLKNKSSRLRYIIAAGLLIISIIVFTAIRQEPKYDPASEALIRKAVGEILIKEPNDLADEDFASIKNFSLATKELSDLRLLEKFTNVQQLQINNITCPESSIPKWMKFLVKLGIFDLDKKLVVDLSPIRKLSNLQELYLVGKSINNIKPLTGLTNLKLLVLSENQVSSLKPIKKLKKLHTLSLLDIPVSNLKPLQNLTNLESLFLDVNGVSDLEPIRNLTNLRHLSIRNTKVSNFEPLKALPNLEELELTRHIDYFNSKENIPTRQVEDLQKALPNLKINWNR